MKLNLVITKSLNIHSQLKIEEALLRADHENWCIINEGSCPSVVLGSSNCPQELINLEHAQNHNLNILRRFSGGGTVVVDHNTLFLTFIFNPTAHNFQPFPEPILKWSHSFYQQALNIEGFSLKENDYTIFDKKVAGNAQYLKKNRWLHHTTFLYDFNPHLMNCLKQPSLAPKYRNERSHFEFLTTLKSYFATKADFIESIKQKLMQEFHLQEVPITTLENKVFAKHRKTTQMIKSFHSL